MTVAMRFTSSLLYILIMGKSCLSPNFSLQQEAGNNWLPTHLLRIHVCGLLNAVANSNNDSLIYITNSLFVAYFSTCLLSLTFHFPSFSQCIQNEPRLFILSAGVLHTSSLLLNYTAYIREVVCAKIRIALSRVPRNFKGRQEKSTIFFKNVIISFHLKSAKRK
jgi:hypothetical protein